jgi:hypothetical protein
MQLVPLYATSYARQLRSQVGTNQVSLALP